MPADLRFDAREAYLDLLAKSLTGYQFPESADEVLEPTPNLARFDPRRVVLATLARKQLKLVRSRPFDPDARRRGIDWPSIGYTMAGLERLANIRYCLEQADADGLPGDWVETGVWRGGASIYAKAVLESIGSERLLWLADSFEGIPESTAEPDIGLASEVGDFSGIGYLAVGANVVRANFERFGLLDDHVKFIEGWFRDTLGNAPIGEIAVLRLDGDLYESTMDALRPLYPKVVSGGFVIVDDYETWPNCRQAIDEYRAAHGITAEIVPIDGSGVYWRKS